MPAAAIIYTKYIINIYHKPVELFIRPKIILSRETRVEIASDFPTFSPDQIINKTRLRLDTTSFYNIIRLLIPDEYPLIKKKTELMRKKSGLTKKIPKNNQSPSRSTSPINNEKITSNDFIKQQNTSMLKLMIIILKRYEAKKAQPPL